MNKRKWKNVPSRAKVLFALLVILAAVGLGTFALLSRSGGDSNLPDSGTALIGGPFQLTDQNGRRVSDADFRGKYMLVFFGYTYCPDVCPTELQVMTQALDSMGAAAEKITPIFVSIDPERDTPATVKAYVENFSPRLVGLTGTPEQVATAAKAYRVYYKKSGDTASANYLMDHSSILYLMDGNGRFVTHFTYTTDAKGLAEALLAATSGTP